MSSLNSATAGAKHKRSLKLVFAITASYLVIEVIVGIISNSLALLSDAAHMLTDVGGQALALFAIWMTSRPRNNKKTYGYYRVEILAALTNALVLIFISVYILYEAWQRFQNPPEIAGIPMLIVAFCGLLVNLFAMKLLREGSKESLNIKGAFLEVVSDMLSSVGVLIAGVVILATGWLYIDPIMSALIGLFILPRTFKLLKESVDILLEAVPASVNYAAVEQNIRERVGVLAVHDLHIWTITSGVTALSVHVVMTKETSFAEINALVSNIKEHLNKEFKIGHTTIEVHQDDLNYQGNTL